MNINPTRLAGDFTRIAAIMRESGEALVQQFGIRKA